MLLLITGVIAIAFGAVQSSYAPSQPPFAVGVIVLNMVHTVCLHGFFTTIGGGCSTNPADIPTGTQVPMPSTGNIHNLFVNISNPTNGTYTIYINNVATTLQCSTLNTISCNNVLDSVSVNAGDIIMIGMDRSTFVQGGTASFILSP